MSAKLILIAALLTVPLSVPLAAQATLKDAFQGDFRIGAALHQAVYTGGDAAGASLVQA